VKGHAARIAGALAGAHAALVGARALLRGLRRLAADPEAVRQLGGRAGAAKGFARAGCAGEVRKGRRV
jgi:hypothetical protein